ncbi:hypothetical protein HMPREF9371_0338 [Neisseria shayeganii 871]|uniref:Uncharacterized protein n=1 Tax=Neisseria shayeganii 871 TaxID=1032488 RepID=G4CFE9_9NEIS|nr:hypothetical protein HMPREF9371_0338 [Neisseria shayeganii 871]
MKNSAIPYFADGLHLRCSRFLKNFCKQAACASALNASFYRKKAAKPSQKD